MRKKSFAVLLAVLLMMALAACSTSQAPVSSSEAPTSAPQSENTVDPSMSQTNALGALTPEDALEYMKNTPNLVIVEVNAPAWKLSNGITGAMWIPYTEMAERYGEIPEARPVLLHCGGGIVSVEAYEIL